MRLTLLVEDGAAVNLELEALGVYPEMHDARHVVFILTGADGEEQLERLDASLTALGLAYQDPYQPPRLLPPPPVTVCTPRAAVFGKTALLPLRDAEGRIAAEQIAPYPPGVPVVAPGERITKMHLAYLTEIGYNSFNEDICVVEDGSSPRP